MNTRTKHIRNAPIIDLHSNVHIPDNVISFGQGIPFFPPPQQALEAMTTSLSDPVGFQYSTDNGRPLLRDIIAEKIKKEQKITVNPTEEIMVTSGANQAFMNTILSITEPGDEIVFFTPTYFNYIMAAELASCKPILINTNQWYKPLISMLKEKITSKTKAIVTVSPNNPTGAVYSFEEMKAINQLCEDHSLYHISDEVYEYFVYDQANHTSALRFDESISHTICLFSLSKAFSLSGFRIGYMIYPGFLQSDLLKAQDTIGICAPTPAQAAALAAIPLGDSYCKQFFETLRKNRELTKEVLTQIPEIRIILTKGAYYFFVTVESSLSSFDLVKKIIEEYGVIVLPGSMFDYSNCSFRLSYGNLEHKAFSDGLQRLSKGLTEILK
mgnify:CR=1 FL=1